MTANPLSKKRNGTKIFGINNEEVYRVGIEINNMSIISRECYILGVFGASVFKSQGSSEISHLNFFVGRNLDIKSREF